MGLRQDDPRPTYLQIAEELRQAIRAGDFPPGSQLPSTTELTKRYDVASMTVRSALRTLRDQGLVVTRQGTGVFVRSTVRPEDLDKTKPSGDAIDLVVERLDALSEEVQDLMSRLDRLEREQSSQQS